MYLESRCCPVWERKVRRFRRLGGSIKVYNDLALVATATLRRDVATRRRDETSRRRRDVRKNGERPVHDAVTYLQNHGHRMNA